MTTTRQGKYGRDAASCNLCGREVLDDNAPGYVPRNGEADWLMAISGYAHDFDPFFGRADFDICDECQQSASLADFCKAVLIALGVTPWWAEA
jgi:hypothetical protein